jgi:hypothetical protein
MHDLAAIARECVEEVNELKVPTDLCSPWSRGLRWRARLFVTVTMPSFLEPLSALPGGTESTRTAQRHGTADKRQRMVSHVEQYRPSEGDVIRDPGTA